MDEGVVAGRADEEAEGVALGGEGAGYGGAHEAGGAGDEGWGWRGRRPAWEGAV